VTVRIDGDQATVNGKTYTVSLEGQAAASGSGTPTVAGPGTPVIAQMPGKVWELVATPGTVVEEGQTVLILEAMKMEVQVNAPVSGTVQKINVAKGDMVQTGAELATIG
jgi:pyruvate carboxylase subunit B